MSAPFRAVVVGDSIATFPYSDTGVARADKSWASLLTSRASVTVNNLSSPGQRMTTGGQPGFGVDANLNMIDTVVGYSGAQLAIITVGVNDALNPGTTMQAYIDAYRRVIKRARQFMPVVVISPIGKSDQAVPINHIDGAWTLDQLRYFTEMVAFEEKAKPGQFVTVFSGCAGSGVPGFNMQPEHYVADGTHLNECGHEFFYNRLFALLQSVGYLL